MDINQVFSDFKDKGYISSSVEYNNVGDKIDISKLVEVLEGAYSLSYDEKTDVLSYIDDKKDENE
jgi:hypothetical protein